MKEYPDLKWVVPGMVNWVAKDYSIAPLNCLSTHKSGHTINTCCD